MEERKDRRILKVVILLFALGLAMAWGMVVGGGLVYAWTHFFEGRDEHAYSRVITLENPRAVTEREMVELGAVVVEVIADTPAYRAGLQAGDRIVAVDGVRVGLDRDLTDVLAGYAPGDRVVLLVGRSVDDSFEVRVRLAEHPDIRGRAYLGIQYAPTSSWGPGMHIIPYGEPGERFRFESPDGEFEFHVIPDQDESH